MRSTHLLSLLAFDVLATFFFIMVFPISNALAQNATTDTSTTTDRIDTTDTSTTGWRKAILVVGVDVVGGTAEASDFLLEVTSSNTDNSIETVQYPDEPFTAQRDTEVMLRVSDMPSSETYYNVEVIRHPGDYISRFEGCSGTWELGERKICKITNYFEPQPAPEFQIVAEPRYLTIEPQSSDYSTLSLLPSEHNSKDTIMNIDLDTQWVGTPPHNGDVSVSLEQQSTRLIGTQPQQIRITVETSEDIPPGQTFTVSVRANGKVDQQQSPISHSINLQIATPPGENDNTIPQAIAVLDKQEVKEGESVDLDGTRSWDADGDRLTYAWKVLSGPPSVQISDEQSNRETLTFDSPQVNEDTKIIFQLTVSDGKPGGIGITTTELSIDDFASDPPGNDERNSNPLIDVIPLGLRNMTDGFIPRVGVWSDNNNILTSLLVAAVVAIGGIALGKYKMNQGKNDRPKISPSAIVQIKAKGGISE